MRSLRWIETILASGAASGGQWVLLAGGSMEPAYSDGDWLLVEPAAGSRPIRPGEVVVARRGERLVTHRVVSLRGGLAVTQGDACRDADPPILISGLIGRVIGVRRGPGRLKMLRRAVRRIRRFLETPFWRER